MILFFLEMFGIIWALVMILKLFCWLLGLSLRNIIEPVANIFYEIYTYFTYTRPNTKNGRLQKIKREKEEAEVLKKAAKEKNEYVKKMNNISRMVTAAVSKGTYFKNKYPYTSDQLINEFIENFAKYSVQQIEEMENRIVQDHLKNKAIHESNVDKQYNLSDLFGKEAFVEKDEYPFKFKLFKINNDYVLHIKDTLENSDTLLQTKNYNDFNTFLMNIEQKFEILKSKNESVVAKQFIEKEQRNWKSRF